MTTPESFADLCGDLPDHDGELMAAHQGTPGTGVPAPAEDRGVADSVKYAGGY